MAGMRVVVVRRDDDGNIDLDDLRAKIDKHRDELAAIMVTYPSTHGVFEETITEVCAAVHDAGGQVYVDGANLNALVGLAQPGRVRRRRLATSTCTRRSASRTAAAAPASARSACASTWRRSCRTTRCGPRPARRPASARSRRRRGARPASCRSRGPTSRMMGADGLRRGHRGGGPHRQLRRQAARAGTTRCSTPAAAAWSRTSASSTCGRSPRTTGVTVDDVAKRLIDYGFHAPTMRFPVAGTLMIEPTESEDLAELDRFCDAMIAIRRRDRPGRPGECARRRQPAARTPRTPRRRCSPATGSTPTPARRRPTRSASLRRDKYWPPVRRIDGAYGDRNLVCSCPPPEAFEG